MGADEIKPVSNCRQMSMHSEPGFVEHVPSNDVNRLPEIADTIFWSADISTSTSPGPSGRGGAMFSELESALLPPRTNLSWFWPSGMLLKAFIFFFSTALFHGSFGQLCFLP